MIFKRKKIRGLQNFREVKNVEINDTQMIRPHALYRGGHLASLNDKKIHKLHEKFGITSVIDFRSPSEVKTKPEVLSDSMNYVHIPPLTDEQNPAITRKNGLGQLKKIIREDGCGVRHLCKIYREMVTSEQAQEAFHYLVRYLIEHPEEVTLWHCSQGKDRTGMGTVVVLMALGANRDAIMKEYLRSNRYFRVKNCLIFAGMSIGTLSFRKALALFNLLSAKRQYLNAAFDEMDSSFGGTDGYLHEGLHLSDLEIQTLRDYYLVNKSTILV